MIPKDLKDLVLQGGSMLEDGIAYGKARDYFIRGCNQRIQMFKSGSKEVDKVDQEGGAQCGEALRGTPAPGS